MQILSQQPFPLFPLADCCVIIFVTLSRTWGASFLDGFFGNPLCTPRIALKFTKPHPRQPTISLENNRVTCAHLRERLLKMLFQLHNQCIMLLSLLLNKKTFKCIKPVTQRRCINTSDFTLTCFLLELEVNFFLQYLSKILLTLK